MNTTDENKARILESIFTSLERRTTAYWREWSVPLFGDEAEGLIDSMLGKELAEENGLCIITPDGDKLLASLHQEEYKDSEEELAEKEKGGIANILRDGVSPDTPIFRYMDIDNFYRLLDSGKNALAHISKWEDPFEGFVFKGEIHSPDLKADIDLIQIYSLYYGQCWTLEPYESDMRWRACGQRGRLVRISSTPKQVYDSLRSILPQNRLHCSCQMGTVQYEDESEIKDLMTREKRGDIISDNKVAEDLLFVKRREFEEEKEFRIILNVAHYKLNSNLKLENGMASYEFDFCKCVNQVLADPCMTNHDFNHLRCRVAMKCPSLPIERSTLFNWPDFHSEL